MKGKFAALGIMLFLMATLPRGPFAEENQKTPPNLNPEANQKPSSTLTSEANQKNNAPTANQNTSTPTNQNTVTSIPKQNAGIATPNQAIDSTENQKIPPIGSDQNNIPKETPKIETSRTETSKTLQTNEKINPPPSPTYQDPELSKCCRTCEDLLSAYLLALEYDPTLQAAKATQLAAREALPQARSQMLPVLSGNATFGSNKWTLPGINSYNTNNFSLTVDQPILHFDHWANYSKADSAVKQANAAYSAAEQDLMVRTAEAYLNVLKAVDGLYFAESQERAFAKFQDQTEQRFKVGLIPITDSEIAKARHDNAVALVISAKAEVEDSFDKLREIIFIRPCKLAPLKEEIPLVSPRPTSIKEWVRVALNQNFTLQAAYYNAEAARDNIRQNNYGHLPTIDLHGEIDNNSAIPNFQPKNRLSTIETKISVPIMQGGLVLSKTREARFNFEKAESQYLFQYLNVESTTRQSYRGVITQMNKIKALKQALRSNESALSATEAAFNVGTRTIVDVLNAQTDLILAQRDYSATRNDYVLEILKLKQAAGTLSPCDMAQINNWLKCVK